MSQTNFRDCPSASLFKQIAAMIYDSLLVFAVLFLASAIALAFKLMLPGEGHTIENNPAFSLYLLFTVFTFYAWFWRNSGQTLGMRVWKIRIVTDAGGNPGWGVCYLRLLFALLSMACFGLGYLWRLFKPYTWHDRLSQTRIVDISALLRAKKQADADPV